MLYCARAQAPVNLSVELMALSCDVVFCSNVFRVWFRRRDSNSLQEICHVCCPVINYRIFIYLLRYCNTRKQSRKERKKKPGTIQTGLTKLGLHSYNRHKGSARSPVPNSLRRSSHKRLTHERSVVIINWHGRHYDRHIAAAQRSTQYTYASLNIYRLVDPFNGGPDIVQYRTRSIRYYSQSPLSASASLPAVFMLARCMFDFAPIWYRVRSHITPNVLP